MEKINITPEQNFNPNTELMLPEVASPTVIEVEAVEDSVVIPVHIS